MDEEPGLVEVLRDAISAIGTAWLFLVVFGIGIALVVMGNMPGRLIGVGLLALWLYFAIRLARRRFAD